MSLAFRNPKGEDEDENEIGALTLQDRPTSGGKENPNLVSEWFVCCR